VYAKSRCRTGEPRRLPTQHVDFSACHTGVTRRGFGSFFRLAQAPRPVRGLNMQLQPEERGLNSRRISFTCWALCCSFALLALYPDEQERLYQHIKGVMPSLNGKAVGRRNLNLYRANIALGVRRHEPLHPIISVSPPKISARARVLILR
jgi:hypothetical protein